MTRRSAAADRLRRCHGRRRRGEDHPEYPGVTLTDYMSLIKVDGEWRIVNKIFHANRQATKSD